MVSVKNAKYSFNVYFFILVMTNSSNLLLNTGFNLFKFEIKRVNLILIIIHNTQISKIYLIAQLWDFSIIKNMLLKYFLILFNVQTRFTVGPLNLLNEVTGCMIDFATDFISFLP